LNCGRPLRLVAVLISVALVGCGPSSGGAASCGAEDQVCAPPERQIPLPEVVGSRLVAARKALRSFEVKVSTPDGSAALATAVVLSQQPSSGSHAEGGIVELRVEASDL
jgi:hypothetical protein